MSDALELAKRALQHFNEGSTDRAPSQMRIPLSAYTDESRFQAEREVEPSSLTARSLWPYPLSSREPGDFQTQTIMGVPLLLTRDRDGTAHCFINVCRHRGAKVCHRKKVIKRGLAAPITPGPTTIAASWWACTAKRALERWTAQPWD